MHACTVRKYHRFTFQITKDPDMLLARRSGEIRAAGDILDQGVALRAAGMAMEIGMAGQLAALYTEVLAAKQGG